MLPRASWAGSEEVGTVTLPFAERQRRRVRMVDDAGAPFLLDLERSTTLADGDGLGLDGGGVLRVRAALEPVIDARSRSEADLARLAWHLGNRHAPIQVLDDGTLRLADDPVLAGLLAHLGAEMVRHLAPFSPERGAYASAGPSHGRQADDGDTP